MLCEFQQNYRVDRIVNKTNLLVSPFACHFISVVSQTTHRLGFSQTLMFHHYNIYNFASFLVNQLSGLNSFKGSHNFFKKCFHQYFTLKNFHDSTEISHGSPKFFFSFRILIHSLIPLPVSTNILLKKSRKQLRNPSKSLIKFSRIWYYLLTL